MLPCCCRASPHFRRFRPRQRTTSAPAMKNPAMSFSVASDSDSSDIVPPPAWRVNQSLSLSASSLSGGRPLISSHRKVAMPTRHLPTQLALSSSNPNRMAHHILVSASKEASGAWGTTTKTDMPRKLGGDMRQATSAYLSVASQQDR